MAEVPAIEAVTGACRLSNVFGIKNLTEETSEVTEDAEVVTGVDNDHQTTD